jgi:dUTP pyrophosphatase
VKYKVGDKVKIIKVTNDAPEETIGMQGVVIAVLDSYYRVDFGDDFWCYADEEVELIPRKIRGFEAVTGYSPVIPKRSTAKSAGYDISIIGEAVVQPGQTVVFPTGLKAYMQDNEVLQIHIRSSVGIKRNLVLSNGTGIIDADYFNNPDTEGHIRVAVTNIGNEPQLINGDKPVAQGIFMKYLTTDDDCADGERKGGIGSTDEL